MPQKYRVELSDGRKFEVEADRPPSEQDVLSALEPPKSSGAPKFGEAPSAADMLSGSYLGAHEGPPTAIERLNMALQPAAHPQSLSDMSTLLLPTQMPRLAGRLITPAAQAVTKYGGAALDLGASFLPTQARAALGVLRTLSPTEWHSPLTVAGRGARVAAASRAFNDQPLATQMSELPSQGQAPEVARSGGPLHQSQTPFNELPLTKQMDRLPTTGGVGSLRTVTPLLQPQTPFHEQPVYQQMAQLPETPAPIGGRAMEPPPRNLGRETPPPTSATPPPISAASASALSPTDRMLLQKQGYPPELIARIEQRLGQSSIQPMPSHPSAAQAMPSPRGLSTGEEAGVQSLDRLLEGIHGGEPRTIGNGLYQEPPMASHPLREPRINVGAEAIGRQQGMSKDAIRQATGPVLDEAVGEASPILPKAALSRIVDDMRALSPGAEREAYVARATSGKAKWQVENIRRTLEHLGLLVPLAVVSQRNALIRMMSSHATDQP